MQKKIIAYGKEARAKLLEGARLAGEYVGSTLGPKGRNAIIETAYHAPKVTNDGVTLLRNIVLNDEIKDLGFQTVVEAAMKTNERAGDGTTTTGVIASRIISDCAKIIDKEDGAHDEALEGIGSKADVVGMSRSILEARDTVMAKLKEIAKPVKKGDLKNIISTSLGKIYPEHVDMLTDIVEKVGADGYISVEDNFGTKYGIDTMVSLGMRFMGSYADPLMTTEKITQTQLVLNRNKEAIMQDVDVFVTNHRIETTLAIKNLIQHIRASGKRKIVIIAEGFEKNFTRPTLESVMNSVRGTADAIRILAIKAPSLTTDQFEDVAAYVGARFVNKNVGDGKLENVGGEVLGHVRKIVVDEDNTMIDGGSGKVDERVKMLKAEIENEKDPAFKAQALRRLGALQSGFAIIRVGAPTEPERDYLKYKLEDAVSAAKSATEEGIVKGGGLALKEIAEELGKDSIVYNALRAPYERIRHNAGGELKIPATVVDPVKVTRLAVENAFSVASQLITAEIAIAKHNKTLLEELRQGLAPTDNEDFRADENQDVRYMA